MPKVSVIIPNFNHAPYLKRRIESVLNQTFQDFEVILLDDCSTDNSVEILNIYKNHPKVSHVVINTENSGSPFRQWAKGFELAKGDYIWIAESDDWCELELLETLVQLLEDDLSVTMSFCQTKLVDSKGKVLYQTKFNETEKRSSGEKFVRNYLFGDTLLVNAGMVVFRKPALLKINNEYLEYKGAGDWMFWIEIALQGSIATSNKHLNYCYRHNAVHTNNSEITGQDFTEGNKIYKYVLEQLNPSDFEIKRAVEQRIDIFCLQKDKYASKNIEKRALNELFSLRKDVAILYYKLLIKRKIKSICLFLKNKTNNE